MNKYKVFETEQFQKDLQQIARSGNEKIKHKLREYIYPQLQQYPHYGPNIKKLKGFHPETWRCRIGAWRFFYEIDDKENIAFMIAASHRSAAY